MSYNRNGLKVITALIFPFILMSLVFCACSTDKITESLVKIYADDLTGTGIIVDIGGYLVTSGHVVGGSKSIALELKSGSRYEGKILCSNQAKDIAVIKMVGNYSGLQAAALGDSDLVHQLDEVSVAGYLPAATSPVISKGTVSALPKSEGTYYLQTNAALDPDLAGSAVLNKTGEVIGIVSWSFNKAGREGFALASNEVKLLITQAQEAEANPLAIISVDPPSVFNDHAIISWKTNRPATGQVEYGLQQAYGNKTAEDATLLETHGSVIQNLQPKTTYHFRVRSVDGCGNEVSSQDYNITTTISGAQTGKFAILNINVYDITSSAASVSWITNKPATSSVSYGMDKTGTPDVKSDSSLVYEHKIRVDGLQAETRYYLNIRSGTEYGESAQETLTPFSTLPTSPVCCKINCRVPDFAFKTPQGTDFTNKDIAGKKTFIVFTKTSCPTCMQQALFLNDIYRNWPKGDNILMFMVASSEKKSDVDEWIKKYGLTVPVYLDAKADLVNACKFRTIPSELFLDTGSVIRDYKSGGFGTKKEMEEALKHF